MDHKNEMFSEWKKSLIAGEFQQADYFKQAYMDMDFCEKNIGLMRQEARDAQQKISKLEGDIITLTNENIRLVQSENKTIYSAREDMAKVSHDLFLAKKEIERLKEQKAKPTKK